MTWFIFPVIIALTTDSACSQPNPISIKLWFAAALILRWCSLFACLFSSAAFSANVSYKKDILEKTGGFDENISATASVELRYRLIAKQKEKILCIPMFVTHHCDLNFFGYIKKLFRQGRCKQYCNDKYFRGNPPLAFDVTFWRASKKLFVAFHNILKIKDVKKPDLPAIFIFLFLEAFLNAAGGSVEKYFSKL